MFNKSHEFIAHVQFYTGLKTKEMFNKSHEFIAPFVKKWWKGVKVVVKNACRCLNPGKKRGRSRKLHSKD